MGNKISNLSCGLINKNGDSTNKIIIANSKSSSDKNTEKSNLNNQKKIIYTSLNRKNTIIENNLYFIKKTFFIDDTDINNMNKYFLIQIKYGVEINMRIVYIY